MTAIIIRNNNLAFFDYSSNDDFDINSPVYLTPFSKEMIIIPKEGILLDSNQERKIDDDDDGFFITCKDRKVFSKMAKKSYMHNAEWSCCTLGTESHLPSKTGSRVGEVVKALAFYQYAPGSILGPAVTWIESVGSLLCSERFFSRFSGFLLSPKTNFTIIICSVPI